MCIKDLNSNYKSKYFDKHLEQSESSWKDEIGKREREGENRDRWSVWESDRGSKEAEETTLNKLQDIIQ